MDSASFSDMHLTVLPYRLSFLSVNKADILPNVSKRSLPCYCAWVRDRHVRLLIPPFLQVPPDPATRAQLPVCLVQAAAIMHAFFFNPPEWVYWPYICLVLSALVWP